jgi:hypothetical protein
MKVMVGSTKLADTVVTQLGVVWRYFPDNSVSTSKIQDGVVTPSKLSDSAKLELEGGYTKLTASTTAASTLVKVNGIVEATAFAYAVQDFDVTAGRLVKVRADIGAGVSPSQYAVVSLWAGTTWVADTVISTSATKYDKHN